MSDYNIINGTELDRHITGNWGEDSVSPDDDIVGMGLDDIQDMRDELARLRQIEQAARRLLQILDSEPWRLTAATFGQFGEDGISAIDCLRAALDAEPDSSQRQQDEPT